MTYMSSAVMRVMLAIGIAALGTISLTATPSAHLSDGDLDVAATLEGYTGWARITRAPYYVPPAVSAACAAATVGRSDPHAGAYITVYVNEIGRAAMLTPGEVKFPEGSVIVKEKRTQAGSASPDLMTVMVKRASGYNAGVGDWEFAVTDGAGAHVQAQGKLTNCAECHAVVPKSDYVFRTYLADPQ
jgi:hypothetical protein